MADTEIIQLTELIGSEQITAFQLITPEAEGIDLVGPTGPPGPQGDPGSGAVVFTDLTDVPSSYTGEGLKVVRVNTGETALEFSTAGAGDALTSNPLSQFAATTSAELLGVISDETGSGALVFGTSPVITTPSGIVKGDVGLGNVTNDVQTKAAIVPNTTPSAGQLLVGNAGGTAYAPVSSSGDVTVASTGAQTIANDVVSYAKMQNVSAASKLVGRGDSSSGDPEEIALGTNLTMSGTTLNASGGGATEFTDLTDVPSSYSGQSLKAVRVNTGETALEFVTLPGGGDALTSDPLSQFAATTSAELRGVLSDENGTGVALFNAATTPSFTTGLQIGGAAAADKILKGNGTNFVPSTETYAAPGTSGNVLTSDGTNWTSAAPSSGGTTSKVSGSDATTTSNAAGNIAGLTFAASANSLYEVDVELATKCSSSGGIKFTVTFSAAGATGNCNLLSVGSSAGTSLHHSFLLGVLDSAAVNTQTTTDNQVWIKAIVKTGANAGNITTQFASGTNGQTSTVYIGSRMTVTQL